MGPPTPIRSASAPVSALALDRRRASLRRRGLPPAGDDVACAAAPTDTTRAPGGTIAGAVTPLLPRLPRTTGVLSAACTGPPPATSATPAAAAGDTTCGARYNGDTCGHASLSAPPPGDRALVATCMPLPCADWPWSAIVVLWHCAQTACSRLSRPLTGRAFNFTLVCSSFACRAGG